MKLIPRETTEYFLFDTDEKGTQIGFVEIGPEEIHITLESKRQQKRVSFPKSCIQLIIEVLKELGGLNGSSG